MTKHTKPSTQTGPVVIGRNAAMRINAVEGINASARSKKLLAESDARGENGQARRDRIRAEFARKQ